jgi:hypothetical protein
MFTLKVYTIVHGAPIIAFSKKRKQFMEKPIETLKRLIIKILGSMCFLGGFIMSMRTFFCLARFRGKFDFLYFLLISIFNINGVVLEDASRGELYAIFTFPKVIEGFWDLFKKIGLVRDIPHSMNALFAISMGIFLMFKKHYPKDMPLPYRNYLSLIFDKSQEEKELETKADTKTIQK